MAYCKKCRLLFVTLWIDFENGFLGLKNNWILFKLIIKDDVFTNRYRSRTQAHARTVYRLKFEECNLEIWRKYQDTMLLGVSEEEALFACLEVMSVASVGSAVITSLAS